MTQPSTHTLDVPGAVLTYDVREAATSERPVLFLIGSPMAAAGFATLASSFEDRTVVTYDPRGSERSARTDPASELSPGVHADDLHRLIEALEAGPVDLFASSGGAVNALVLVARSPEQVRTLVAHEPPLASQLPDRDAAQAAARAIHETYRRSGWGSGMAHFITVVTHRGEFPGDFADRPAPDPAMFGMPTEDDGSRDDPMLGENMINLTHYEPDYPALRAASTRIVLAAGVESEGELANRGAFAVAERLGTRPVLFPSHHGGFLGGEYGQTGDPEAFATKLREILDGTDAPTVPDGDTDRLSRHLRFAAGPGPRLGRERSRASTVRGADGRDLRPSCFLLRRGTLDGQVLGVGHLLAPLRLRAIRGRLPHRQVRHEAVGCGPMPVPFPGRSGDGIAGMDLDDPAAAGLAPAQAIGDVERLAHGMPVPRIPGTRCEANEAHPDAGWALATDQDVVPGVTGEHVGRGLGRRLTRSDLHGRAPSCTGGGHGSTAGPRGGSA